MVEISHFMSGEISLCSGCGCMTNDIVGSNGNIYCGKFKTCKTSNTKTYKIDITKPFNNFIKDNEKLLKELSK